MLCAVKHTIVERADVFWFSDTQALLRSDNGYISVCTKVTLSRDFSLPALMKMSFMGEFAFSAAISSILGSAAGMK